MPVAEQFAHLPEIERRRIQMPPHNMRLNRLERPEAWPSNIRAKVLDAIANTSWHLYPDYPAFYERLAQFLDVRPTELVVGAGIEEFIRSLMLLHSGKRVAMLWPTCAMFELYARAFSVELIKIKPNPHERLRIIDVVEACREFAADLLLLVNPGQPVPTYFPRGDIFEICERLPDTWVAVDEAYHGFGAESAIGGHAQFKNLTVLRTFSKAFGAAGIRLGYAVGARSTLDYLDAIRPSGEVGALSMATARVLMDNWLEVEGWTSEVIGGRDWLRRQFQMSGLPAWGLHGNSVLVEYPDPAGICEQMAARGVLMRNVTGLDGGYFMVTCGSIELMQKFWSVYDGIPRT